MDGAKPDLTWMDAWDESGRDPYKFAIEVLGFLPADAPNPNGRPQLEEWQDDFLRDFFVGPDGKPTDAPRHSVRAGHGVGKGMILAILALWFVSTHYDAKCVVTANSQDQLRDNNWPEIRKVFRMLPPSLQQQIDIQEERITLRAAPDMAFVVRRTASRSNPEALQGIHAVHVLYLVDEASGIAEVVFEVAQGSLSSAGAMAVLFSNPTKASGYFFDTHHTLRSMWRCLRVNCEDVPRAQGHIAGVILKYGKDSNKHRVRVLGEFPTRDDDTVMPLEWCEAAQRRKVAAIDVMPLWGVDVARFGDDSSALVKRQGNVVLEAPIVWKNMDTVQIATRIANEYQKTWPALRPSEILIDVIGYGAGVVDVLRRVCHLPIARGVNVAESASAKDEYFRLRDELYFCGRAWFQAADCVLPAEGCERLITQLTTPTYDFTTSGKKSVESKDEFKKRLGYSPDEGDAFLNTFAGTPRMRPKEHGRGHGDSAPRGASGWTG